MAEYRFHLDADWAGGRNSVGAIRCGHLQERISIATSMGGPGIGTNPDEMLLGAAATCYLITLAAMIERASLAVQSMSLESTIMVEVNEGAFQCRQIVHRPQVMLAADAGEAGLKKLEYLVGMASRRCMISNALRGNVEIRIEPQLAIAA